MPYDVSSSGTGSSGEQTKEKAKADIVGLDKSKFKGRVCTDGRHTKREKVR